MLQTRLIFAFLLSSLAVLAQPEQSNKTALQDSIKQGVVAVNANEAILNLMDAYKRENTGKQISGYRIQLYSGNRKGAFDLKLDFMKKIPETNATVVYESPDFKLQVGDYRTKLEAERAMEVIWPQYKSAFVVKTMIDLPKLEKATAP